MKNLIELPLTELNLLKDYCKKRWLDYTYDGSPIIRDKKDSEQFNLWQAREKLVIKAIEMKVEGLFEKHDESEKHSENEETTV